MSIVDERELEVLILTNRIKRAALTILCAGLIVFQTSSLWAVTPYDDDEDCDVDGVDLYQLIDSLGGNLAGD